MNTNLSQPADPEYSHARGLRNAADASAPSREVPRRLVPSGNRANNYAAVLLYHVCLVLRATLVGEPTSGAFRKLSLLATLLVASPALAQPAITSQPTNQTAVEGRSASFSVTATGSAPLSYQWYSSVMVNTNFDPLIAGVTTLSYPGATLGSVVPQSTNWWPIAKGVSNNKTVPAAGTVIAAREYYAGRVIACGHGTIVGLPAVFDNNTLRLNMIRWLTGQGNTNVAFTSGHGEGGGPTDLRNLLVQNGFQTLMVNAPVTSNQLATAGALVIDARLDFTTNEIEVVRQFVQAGGGLCMSGLGWSWMSYVTNNMSLYPMVKLAAPFQITWLDDYVSDPNNLHPVKTLIPGGNDSALSLSFVNQTNAGYYAVRVTNDAGSVFSDNVFLTVRPGGPVIVSQPASRTNGYGTSATFSVALAGTVPFSYQWRRSGTNLLDSGNLAGTTTGTLTVSNVTANDACGYDVVITNAYGSVTSAVATVTALDPAIIVQPASQIGQSDGVVTFSVTAAGTGSLSYQWRKDNAWVPQGSTSTLTLTNLSPTDAGNYDVVVCGASGCVISTVATLAVNQATSDSSFNTNGNGYSTMEPRALAVQADGKILVSGVSATGQTNLYFWRRNADGTFDARFNPRVNDYVHSVAVQSDGRILIGGRFTMLGGQTNRYLGRLNADGTTDYTFNANANSSVYSLLLQADGRVVVGGAFTTLGGLTNRYIAATERRWYCGQQLQSKRE